MPRNKSKHTSRGTRRSRLTTSRRTSSPLKTRLLSWGRRFGVVLCCLVLTIWIGTWLVLSGAGQNGLGWAQDVFLTETQEAGLQISGIIVEGRERTDPDLLRALTNMQEGDPLLAFDPDAAREAIERISWVKSARVERRWPSTIFISLTERKPFALWQHEGNVRVIDDEGEVLTEQMQTEFEKLLLVTGEDAPQHAAALLNLLSAEPVLYQEAEAAMRVAGRRWDLKLKNGMTILLPETDPGYALRRLALAQETEAIFSKNLDRIDMRREGQMIVERR